MHRSVFQLFNSLSRELFLENSHNKAIHFCSHKYGSRPLSKQQKHTFLGSHKMCYGVFSVVKQQKKLIGKPALRVALASQKRNPPLSRSLPVRKCNTGLI